jgi:hypothetical protein
VLAQEQRHGAGETARVIFFRRVALAEAMEWMTL